MPDPTTGTDNTAISDAPGAMSPEAAAQSAAKSSHKLVAGERWHDYQIERAVTGGGGNLFLAKAVSTTEMVHVRAMRVTEAVEWRRGAWERLGDLPPAAKARLIGCVEAQEEGGWRYEVTHIPPPTNLREWMACHKADKSVVDDLMQQITVVIGAMHAQGVVHLNLRPDTIFVDDSRDDEMGIVLGGIEEATLYTQPVLELADVDPLYAPPEAAGKKTHPPGTGLCAWDWWSVGRVVQEFLLGRHVMHVVVGSGPAPANAAELRARAEALLLEIEPPGLRAGAVEAMGPIMPALKSLMRGLLTAARDARWRAETVQRWLAGEPVANHYDLPRDARLFVWKGRGMPLTEVVDYFTREENWADGEENLFHPENPDTLSHFLSTVSEHAEDWQSLKGVFDVAELPTWGEVPVAARRTVTAAAAWLTLSHRLDRRIPLRVLGQTIDSAGLSALLGDSENVYGGVLVQALTREPCIKLIAPLDPYAARILSRLAQVSGEALRQAELNRWLDHEDIGGHARILRLSLDPETALNARIVRLRTTYASCRDPELARLLAGKELPAWAPMILIYTAEDPIRFGYITHAEWNRQQVRALQDRSQNLRTALFWLRTKQVLTAGGPITGSWFVFVVFWLAVTAGGMFLLEDDVTTTMLVLGLLALRLAVSWRVGRLARQIDPAAKAWGWHNGPRECAVEVERNLPDSRTLSCAILERQLGEIDAEARARQASGFRPALAGVPQLPELWCGLAAGTLLAVVLCVQSTVAWSERDHSRITWLPDRLKTAPKQTASVAAKSMQSDIPEAEAIFGFTPEMAQKVARGEYEVINDGFGRHLRGPLTKWENFAPSRVMPLPVSVRQVSTPLQQAYAKVSAELLLQPYARNTVNVFIAVQVPMHDGVGLMVFNGRDRQLADKQAFALSEAPADHTWYQIDQRRVIYLGVPPELKREKTLASE